jgi:hypothetical protein
MAGGAGPGTGCEDAGMINAGIAEYAAILTGTGGTTLASFDPSMNAVAIAGVIIFLFWLVVFKL